MDIEKINRKHLFEADMYYRLEKGLSSRLVGYKNGVFRLEVIIHSKWNKNYSVAAAEMAYIWKDNYEELKDAIACKVYIIDTKTKPYKKQLLDAGVTPEYDGKKGVLFYKQQLN